MERTPVQSSNVKSVGFDFEAGILEIEFKRKGADDAPGTVYRYEPAMPAPTLLAGAYVRMIEAHTSGESVGAIVGEIKRRDDVVCTRVPDEAAV